MRTIAAVIAAGWIFFWIYWIASAFNSKKDTTPNSLERFLGIRVVILILAAALAIVFNHLPRSFRTHPFGTNHTVLAVGLAAFLSGLALAIWARVYLGKNWGMPMTRKRDPELVTTGPYRYVRHPIYTGMLFMALGSAADVNAYWLIVFVVAAVFFVYSAVAEEKLLVKQFPEAYPAYKARTKMLVPFIF